MMDGVLQKHSLDLYTRAAKIPRVLGTVRAAVRQEECEKQNN